MESVAQLRRIIVHILLKFHFYFSYQSQNLNPPHLHVQRLVDIRVIKEMAIAMMKTTIVDVNMMVGIVVVLKSIRLTAKNVNARRTSPGPNPDPLNLHVQRPVEMSVIKEMTIAMTKTTIVDVIMMVGIVVVLKSIRVTAKNVNASNEKLANNMSIFFGHQVLFSLQMSLYQKHTPFYFQSILVLVSTIFFAIFEINTPALPPSCFQSEVCMFLKYQCSMYTNSGY